MTDGLKIAVVLSLAAIVSAFLISGRYTIVGSASSAVPAAYVVDRFTGSVQYCAVDNCYLSLVHDQARKPATKVGHASPAPIPDDDWIPVTPPAPSPPTGFVPDR